MPGKLEQLKADMLKLASPEKAGALSRFFKTGKGEYGEGDVFLGIMVPDQRRIAKKYADLSMNDLRKLISGRDARREAGLPVHPYKQVQKGGQQGKKGGRGFLPREFKIH